MSSGHFYITTPIYYANDQPHIGHAYTTILADVLNRYHNLMGQETFFLTGTDEHGQKVQQAAEKRGIDPKLHVDEFHLRFKDLWKKLEIKCDRFIRTTDEDHKEHVQRSLQELWDRGEIYEEEYAGWYSVSEERFFSEDELEDGKDPISGRPVEWLKEKNYFFRMSKYHERLIKHIEQNPDFIQPDFRRNEVLGFLRSPLRDLCISRPRERLSWGIPIPFDEKYVTYVWFDALLNYQTGVLGHSFKNGDSAWPADYHIIGKDILTTHCVYWPTMLMGMDRPLPRHILAHGWWLARDEDSDSDEKMSKTTGNVVNPMDYADKFGVDQLRYFLMREMVVGQDSSFGHNAFITRINSELANDLGNAINRVNKFVLAHYDGRLPNSASEQVNARAKNSDNMIDSASLQVAAENCIKETLQLIEDVRISVALERINALIRLVNRFIDGHAPWNIIKEIKQNLDHDHSEARQLLGGILYDTAEALRIALMLLAPVMPDRTRVGLSMLGYDQPVDRDHLAWGVLKGGTPLVKADALFPRIESTEKNKQAPDNKNSKGGAGSKQKGGHPPQDLDPAAKLDLRVAQIREVADHPEADALYMLTVFDGEAERTVCAGLKKYYTVEEMQDRNVILFANLKPAKLRGIESHGMLLAASKTDEAPQLLDPGSIEIGTILSFDDMKLFPKKKASIKDYDKLGLKVKDGAIHYGDKKLGAAGQLIQSSAPDDAEVR